MKHIRATELPWALEFDATYYVPNGPETCDIFVVSKAGHVRKVQPGNSAPVSYLHDQAAASDMWTINHNLGFRPSVTLFTVGGVEFEAEIIHLSDNQCIVYIATSIAGQARCN